jgi:hypothetical protein
MLWMDSVRSLRYQTTNTPASTMAHSSVVPAYGMPTTRCRVSDTPVPKIAMA